MDRQPHGSSNITFVVRFWRAWSEAGAQWRGRVEHVHSGEAATFLELQLMVDFVRSFGIMPADEAQPADRKGGT